MLEYAIILKVQLISSNLSTDNDGLPGELDKLVCLSLADNFENARRASGKFGGVQGVFAGVI